MTAHPDGKRFAFTVFDDTDQSTIENTRPVYDLLADLGLQTTKSVWPLPSVPWARVPGTTLEDSAFRDFVIELQSQGFEIGLHNVRNHDATRPLVVAGLERFREVFGTYPRTHTNHSRNRENLYWGSHRLTSRPIRIGYGLATRFTQRHYFGHVENSPHFWGDLCREHISYVRNFVFDEVNLLRVNPTLPYHDPRRPYVNYWFSSTDGATVDVFNRALTEENQDRLEEEGGVCIMYTHFADGFAKGSQVDPEFKRLLTRLAAKPGWFVPVATLLDNLRDGSVDRTIPGRELRRMERRWFLTKLRQAGK